MSSEARSSRRIASYVADQARARGRKLGSEASALKESSRRLASHSSQAWGATATTAVTIRVLTAMAWCPASETLVAPSVPLSVVAWRNAGCPARRREAEDAERLGALCRL